MTDVGLGMKQQTVTWPQLNMVAESQAMKTIVAEVRKVVRSLRLPVLILGETGTGKEEVARLVHESSGCFHNRTQLPFVGFNCAAIPETLIDSELFGYERGSFTGADKDKAGILERAGEGTIFLDEIGEISPLAQAKLLRFLAEREITRIGGKTVKINSRIISATNRNLDREVWEGKFREDLYHRLAGFLVRIPPLRERKEEIEPLAKHFVRCYRELQQIETEITLDPSVLQLLYEYSWPGNVRELSTAIERAIVYAEGRGPLLPEDFSLNEELPHRAEGLDWDAPSLSENVPMEEVEKRYILAVFNRYGNKKKAARHLGIYRPTLYRKLEEYGVVNTRTSPYGKKTKLDLEES